MSATIFSGIINGDGQGAPVTGLFSADSYGKPATCSLKEVYGGSEVPSGAPGGLRSTQLGPLVEAVQLLGFYVECQTAGHDIRAQLARRAPDPAIAVVEDVLALGLAAAAYR